MPFDISRTTQTSMDTAVLDYSVANKVLDTAQQNETSWENSKFTEYLGYYKQIPELKKSIDALAMWTTGKGWVANAETTVLLNHITGWGEDSFDSLMFNMIVIKKINGDAYAEIIRDPQTDTLINIKPLNPQTMRTVVNQKGLIDRYEELDTKNKTTKRTFPKEKILHLVNDRIGNEIHGVSVVEACKWVIDARNEAMADRRRILHRSTIRVIEVESDDTLKLSTLKTQYAEAINKGEVLIVPKDNVSFPDVKPLSTQDHDTWIRYLENFFYQAVGVPKIILGGAQEYTEASSKIGFLTFEQPYMTEQRLLEQDLWNQLGIKIKFNRPVSLKDEVQSSEAANTGQIGFQANETKATMSRTE